MNESHKYWNPVLETLPHEKIRQLQLKKFKKTLKDKELVIYETRLLAENPATLQEIGDKYGVTRERTRQIEERLLRKIKAFLKEEIPGIEEYQIKIG